MFCLYLVFILPLWYQSTPKCEHRHSRDTRDESEEDDLQDEEIDNSIPGPHGDYSKILHIGHGRDSSKFELDWPRGKPLNSIWRLLKEYKIWKENMSYSTGLLISKSALPKPSRNSTTSNLDYLFPGANLKEELESAIGVRS